MDFKPHSMQSVKSIPQVVVVWAGLATEWGVPAGIVAGCS